MAKVLNSGLHKLQSLFGESVFEYSSEIKRLQSQLQMLEHDLEIATNKAQSGDRRVILFVILEFVGCYLFFGLLMKAVQTYNQSDDLSGIAGSFLGIAAVVAVVGFLIAVVMTYMILSGSHKKKATELESHCSDLQRQLTNKIWDYGSSIVERLKGLASKRGEVGRTLRRGPSAWIFYCPSYIALVDIRTEELVLVTSADCRDIQLSYRELERTTISSGVIESTASRSLGGAAIGALLFGDTGMIAGSVIGSAGERNMSVQTVESKSGKFVVDLYTRLQDIPVVSIEFADDEASAKQFYAIMSVPIKDKV